MVSFVLWPVDDETTAREERSVPSALTVPALPPAKVRRFAVYGLRLAVGDLRSMVCGLRLEFCGLRFQVSGFGVQALRFGVKGAPLMRTVSTPPAHASHSIPQILNPEGFTLRTSH